MKFGKVDVSKATGALLAHATKVNNTQLKKGHKLSKAECEMLEKNGVGSVVVARLQKDDVDENKAAKHIANAILNKQLNTKKPFTGRVNIFAKADGLIEINKETINKLNRISPDITIATINNDSFVTKGQMVATIKIIPLAITKKALTKATKVAKQKNIIRLFGAKPKKVGLVATMLPHTKETILDKTEQVLKGRLEETNSVLVKSKRVRHNDKEVEDAVREINKQCDVVIVFGASAITDKNDVIPQGVRQAGGKVVHLGMPVDPGNLLMLAKIKKQWVIGAPGCARSSANNGFDYVLRRTICNAPLNSQYITGLGVGGLLKEIKERGKLREE